MKWQSLAAGFLLFIALCASIAYWGLQLFKPPVRPVAATQAAKPEIKLDAALALLGGRMGGATVVGNFQLTGVVVAGKPDESVAIITTEGKPPRAIGVNSEVASGVVVREVHPQYVTLSDGGVTKRIELPVNPTGSQSSIALPVRPVLPTIVPPGSTPEASPPVPENNPPSVAPVAPVTPVNPQSMAQPMRGHGGMGGRGFRH